MIVERLDQFDLHMPGKAHRDGDIGARGLAPVELVRRQKMVEQEERASPAIAYEMIDRRADVRDDERRLHDPAEWLPEP
jgi:hypothetical protein